MRRINFQPALMVENLAKLYINLSAHEDWNKAVVGDERSFSMAMVEEAGRILSKSSIPVRFVFSIFP